MGRKRFNHESKFQPNKRGKRCKGVDWISQLPDEILITVLSSLPLKEAARTSILSSRWTNLWKYTFCLKFGDDSALERIAKRRKSHNVEVHKYVKWVNSVLKSHKGLVLKEFRICFDLYQPDHKAITRWLEFAFARKVERLELELFQRIGPRKYVFPVGSLSFDFKSLKALRLESVDLSGEAVELILRKCPLLEQLIIYLTDTIKKLEVCGSSLMLKHLEIARCFGLQSMKVSAPKLTYLRVTRLDLVSLQNVPMLVEVDVLGGEFCDDSIKKVALALRCCISQLESLTLRRSLRKGIIGQCKFPELPKLKTLFIDVWGKGDESLLPLTSFIRASPYLEEFEIKLCWDGLSRTKREVKNDIEFRHQHLKVVKFTGYYGRASDVELVTYLLGTCVALEKIIIDPRYQSTNWCDRLPELKDVLDDERTTKIYAKQQLEALVPSHIKLIIL